MKIMRTANAGVLIELDGKRILIDGMAKTLEAYEGTPLYILSELYNSPPDITLFTHKHPDHFDREYADFAVSESLYLDDESQDTINLDDIWIRAVKTGHIGARDVSHVSFVIKGSKTLFFMGDASPSYLKQMEAFGVPDVLFVPFAYGLTPSAWRNTKNTGAKAIVLLHLPKEELDEQGICKSVYENIKDDPYLNLLEIGETIEIK